MTEESRAYPLVMELTRRSRLGWHWVAVIIATVLILLLMLAAYLDGVFADLSHWETWRNLLDGPTLVLYILVIYPPIWRMWQRAAQSLEALLPADERNPKRESPEGLLIKRRWEWVALIIGAVFWLVLWQPWAESWRSGVIWLSAYDVFTQLLLFSLLGWLLYSSFSGNRYINRLSRQNLNMDIFDTNMLTPVTRSSLGFTIVFIGGISLNLGFQTQEDLLMWNNIIVWVILLCFVVLLFFLSMWGTHSMMSRAKRHELDLVQNHLKSATHELRERAAEDSLKGAEELSLTITMWMNYERRVKEAPEWPFNATIIRRLAASTLVPIAVFLLKVFSGLGIRM